LIKLNRLTIICAASLLAALSGVAAFLMHSTSTPRELFEQRCDQCHPVPDLVGYRQEDMAPLVRSMRFNNNAAMMISDEEEREIVAYLESFAISGDQSFEENGGYWGAIPLPPRTPAESFVVDIVLDQLTFPASINFAPDGSLFILERGNLDQTNGTRYPPLLKRFEPSTGRLITVGVIEGSDVLPAPSETINGGALGLALDPDFAGNGRIYICYHYLTKPGDDNSGASRLSSFTVTDNKLTDERILVDKVPGEALHNGCRVVVGPEGYLYYATGTGHSRLNAQNLSSTAGKILRVRTDGSIPPDNPFPGSPVWSYGHRNPQGLAFDPSTGVLWSTEHGERTDDELNLIEAGRNYGFPYCGGEASLGQPWGKPIQRSWKRRLKRGLLDAWSGEPLLKSMEQVWTTKWICDGKGMDESSYRSAVKSYYPTGTVAISDMVFYEGDAFPAWHGSLFFVTLKTGRLIRVTVDEGNVTSDELLIDGRDPANYGRLRDVTVGPDGYLYVVTNVTNPLDPLARPMNPRGSLLLRIRPPQS